MSIRKSYSFVLVLALVAVGLIVVRLISPEDTWLCQSGQWVKHGNPSGLMPESGCGNNPDLDRSQPQKPEGIEVDFPKPYDNVRSPLKISGQARGSWFFEASFPVVLVDWDGKIIAQGQAKANPPDGGDWMTENFVPFEASLEFTKPDYKNNGALIFKKDNPSGLPQNDQAYEMPIYFE